jgi:hypothetical protein
MLDIDREMVYRLSPQIIFKGIQDVCFWVFNLENGDHYSINATTFRILQLIVAGQSIRSISEILASEYNVNATRAGRDLRDVLDRLLKDGIIIKGGSDETIEEKAL